MKPSRCLAVVLALSSLALLGAGVRLPENRDAFFMENNLVYQRFLALMRGGDYRQINKDRASCLEVDHGTWDQAADGTVRLHSVHHALRFRALLAGPLTTVLADQAAIDALPSLAEAIRRFLDSTGDAVFAARSVDDFRMIAIDPQAETFRRADLQTLLRQIDDTVFSERTGTFSLTPLKTPGIPVLLILQDAVFQTSDLARVRRDYRVKPGEAPPFFFAQVDAATFARNVGTWKVAP